MDFFHFTQVLSIADKSGIRYPLTPTPWLQDYELVRGPRDILIKERQTFSTTWELARSLWMAVEKPRTQIAVLCANANAISGPYHQLLDLIKSAPQIPCEVRTKSVCFHNASDIRFLAYPGAVKTGKSRLIHRLHIPEAAFFEAESELFVHAQFECVPSSGEILLESSLPENRKFRPGFFAEAFRAAVVDMSSEWNAHVFGGPVPKLRAPL